MLRRGIVDHKLELSSELVSRTVRILMSILEKLFSFCRLNIDVNNKIYIMITSREGNERYIEISVKTY